MRLGHLLKERPFASGVAILALTQFGASLAGFVREKVLAETFQSNIAVVDAYIAAFRPSDFLFQTCIMSAMGTVLVPILAGYKAMNQKDHMAKILSGTMGIASLAFGAVALILGIFFPWIAGYLVNFEGETFQFYVTFGRIALLINFLFVFGNASGQYLITLQKYWIYGLTPILYTVGTILGTIYLTPVIGPYGPIIGTLAGAVIYVILRLSAIAYHGYKATLSAWHPDIPEMIKLMLPRVLSLGAFQLQLLVLDSLASGLPEGSVTVNAYARNFQSVLVGVVGIAVAQSVYSVLSQAAARGDEKTYYKYLKTGIGASLLLTIPGSIVLVLLAPIAGSILGLGSRVPLFVASLMFYALSIPFESLVHLLLRAFYARKNTLTPAIILALGGLIPIIIAVTIVGSFGVRGLAIAYTCGLVTECLMLAIFLPRKGKMTPKIDPIPIPQEPVSA